MEIESIPNGIPCKNKSDKELVYTLFTSYQNYLQTDGTFDVDDVTMEAISHLNAPIWRRNRQTKGYDYIIVDEMHLFNLNEQSVFHYISKDVTKKDIPICFALDYNQAIGDLGNTDQDYISSGKLGPVKEHTLGTVFRNSPQIAEFCASIAASGTLMFGGAFNNPYEYTQNQFTQADEKKMSKPVVHMYPNDDSMITALNEHLSSLMRKLQCKQKEIAVISFDNRLFSEEGLKRIEELSNNHFQLLNPQNALQGNLFVFASPYDINGLEFKAVILLGVDEGRLPQTAGTSDISKNYIMYSAFNMLYLAASRAKYDLILMGSEVNGMSSCLEHAISVETISARNHTTMTE